MMVTVDCPSCEGKKQVEVEEQWIAPEDLARHNERHGMFSKERTPCNCRRVKKMVKRDCIRCGKRGKVTIEVKVPKPGDKVVVRDSSLLSDMGIPEYIGKTATILTLNDPKIDAAKKEPMAELRVTANVTWQETNKRTGKVLQRSIKENEGIETFAFTPTELRWV